MKQTKHKITASIQDKITKVAQSLPPVARYDNGKPVYKPTYVPGKELTRDALKPGVPLYPDQLYQVNRLQYENHTMNMVKGVQKDGPIFIDHYSAAVKAQHQAFLKADKESKSLINKFKSWLKKKKQTPSRGRN